MSTQIPLSEILDCLSHRAAKETHGKLWYYSPSPQMSKRLPFDRTTPEAFEANSNKNIGYPIVGFLFRSTQPTWEFTGLLTYALTHRTHVPTESPLTVSATVPAVP